MTSPINNNHCKNIIPNHQSGITLILAILVLASVMAIAFSLATILFIEVRVSGDLVRSEPALYASTAVTEEALFGIRRRIPRCTSGCHAGQLAYSTKIGNVDLANPAPAELVYNDPIIQDKVLSVSNSITNTQNRYFLYDPANINTGSGYSKIRVTYKNTGVDGQIHVYVCEFPSPSSVHWASGAILDCNTISPNTYMVIKNQGPISQNQGLNQGQTTADIIIVPDKQQELIIFSSGPTADRYVQIETFGSDSQPKGMPFYGETAVDINAQNSGVSRSLRVIIPEN